MTVAYAIACDLEYFVAQNDDLRGHLFILRQTSLTVHEGWDPTAISTTAH